MVRTPAERAEAPDPLPSQGVRTTLSFLLFLHLSALLVAVASNFGPVSALRGQLGAVPAMKPYLQLLDMDLAYNYQYTYGEQLDDDHSMEIELNWSGAPDPAADRMLIPEPGIRPNIRYQRYRNLMRNAAERVAEGADESLLPHAVARAMLAERGITSGVHRIRCRRLPPLTMDQVGSTEPRAPERYVTVYEADVRFIGKQLVIVGVARALETAPVDRNEEGNE